MIRKQKRRWKRANRRFNRAFARGQRLSEKQKAVIAAMESANAELHKINEELGVYGQEDEP